MALQAQYSHSDPNLSPSDSLNAIDACFPAPFPPSLPPCPDTRHAHASVGITGSVGAAGASALLPPPRLLQRVFAHGAPMDRHGRVVVGVDPALVEPRVHRDGGHVQFTRRAEVGAGWEGLC